MTDVNNTRFVTSWARHREGCHKGGKGRQPRGKTACPMRQVEGGGPDEIPFSTQIIPLTRKACLALSVLVYTTERFQAFPIVLIKKTMLPEKYICNDCSGVFLKTTTFILPKFSSMNLFKVIPSNMNGTPLRALFPYWNHSSLPSADRSALLCIAMVSTDDPVFTYAALNFLRYALRGPFETLRRLPIYVPLNFHLTILLWKNSISKSNRVLRFSHKRRFRSTSFGHNYKRIARCRPPK